VKAVSTLVATAILLVITVAGGIIIYNYVMNALSAAKQYSSLSMVSARMVVLENSTVVNIKVTNIGTAPAKITSIKLMPLEITVKVDAVVEPGTTKSINVYLNEKLNTSTAYFVIVCYDGGETEPYKVEVVT